MKVTFIDKKTATFGDMCIGDTFTRGGDTVYMRVYERGNHNAMPLNGGNSGMAVKFDLDDEIVPCEARLTVERGGEGMTREENLYWLNREIETWENECQSKHPIKEALYAARKALKEQRKGHWTGDGHGHIVCTACNSANVTIWKSNFCPSCGADMREDK